MTPRQRRLRARKTAHISSFLLHAVPVAVFVGGFVLGMVRVPQADPFVVADWKNTIEFEELSNSIASNQLVFAPVADFHR
jgi:hypothetical protein